MRVSAEARFITRCVREPEDLLPHELQQIARGVQDWHVVTDLAARHGVAHEAGHPVPGGEIDHGRPVLHDLGDLLELAGLQILRLADAPRDEASFGTDAHQRSR